jgi:adenylosuccinate synthase
VLACRSRSRRGGFEISLTIVVGGQYGSEGKGKVAQHFVKAKSARAVVRVGGTNSGHTTLADEQSREVLRQLPTAALEPDVLCVLAAGSYIDIDILTAEVDRLGLGPDRLVIDPGAMIITAADRDAERTSDLKQRIGSTASGTGEAVVRRTRRLSERDLAAAAPELQPYLASTRPLLRGLLDAGEHVVVEGTQGFGLSLLHSPHFPKATSRDTTAAGALAETGLSPFDVENIVLVLRCFPIRVAGDSGPFGAEEIDWKTVGHESGATTGLVERTSVTNKVRRVARFDAHIVREAIAANTPSVIVLNHLDHVDAAARAGLTPKAAEFVGWVAETIGRPVDLLGLGPDTLVEVSDREPSVA